MNAEKQEYEKSTNENEQFSKLGLRPELLRALEEIGYRSMFPIQREAIPPLLNGEDVVGQAHTGSGKTAAFALPILQKIESSKSYVQALIVVPTRELALQVTDEFNKLARHLNAKAYAIYGGQAITPQIERLTKKTPQVVVATPGRLIDHIERNTIDLQDVRIVILDEADRMLDMGFIDDVDYIMKQLPTGTQTALFSATMPGEILKLTDKYMENPVEVLIDSDELSVEEIEQKYAIVDQRMKLSALSDYIKKNKISSGIVFCSTKIRTQRLADKLQSFGFRAAPIHGDLSQARREQAMRNFRKGYVELLVATDVAARGIDVPAVSHVINYDVPQDPLTYFHRIGRTARAGKSGSALTLVSNEEYPDFSRIMGMTEVEIKKATDISSEGTHPTGDIGFSNYGNQRRRPQGRRFDQRRPNRYGGRGSRPSHGHRSFGRESHSKDAARGSSASFFTERVG